MTSLRNKFVLLQRNYNAIKKSRKKRGKVQVQAEIEAAEVQAAKLEERVEQVEGELMNARREFAEATRGHHEAQLDAECAQAELERRVAALQAEAREKHQGGLQEIALLTMELEEMRGHEWEEKYQASAEQVCCSPAALIGAFVQLLGQDAVLALRSKLFRWTISGRTSTLATNVCKILQRTSGCCGRSCTRRQKRCTQQR